LRQVVVAVTATLVILGLMLGYFVPGLDRVPPAPPRENERAAGLGITYLPLNSGLADYYDLGVKSGALITEIVPNSPAEQAGLKAGDVILSYNGASVEEGDTLLGVIRSCQPGSNVIIIISRQKTTETVSFIHPR